MDNNIKKCKDCWRYKGDCGNHPKDKNNHINYEIPSKEMNLNGIPWCFEGGEDEGYMVCPKCKYMDIDANFCRKCGTKMKKGGE